VFEHLFSRFIGNGLGDMASDALATGVSNVLEEQLAPIAAAFVGELRGKLLEMVAGDPPATYQAELEQLGMQIANEKTLRALWGATVRAIAAQPATPRAQLRALTGGSTDGPATPVGG